MPPSVLSIHAQFSEYFEDYRHFLYLLFLITRLRPVILKSSPGNPSGPSVLPPAVSAYLVDALRLPSSLIAVLWTALQPFLTELVEDDYSHGVDDLARLYGRTHGLGEYAPLLPFTANR